MNLFNMYIFNFNIPMACGLVIDDMGWCHSTDLTPVGGPPRLNTDRDPLLEDYKNMVEMAKTCGTRIFCAFVMSEFDQNNICAKEEYNKPISPINVTEFGKDWHNNVTKTEIMDFVKNNPAFIDFALHGVRHGHFTPNKWENGEWARRAKKDDKGNFFEEIKTVTPWDPKNDTNRIIAKCFKELISQYFTEEELDFPESFVPPNHAYYYEEGNDNTTGAILSEYGVKYCNFKHTGSGSGDYNFKPVVNWDHSLCLLDRRGIRGCGYRKTGAIPKLPPRPFPWIEAHFNNIWGTSEKWGEYLYKINRHPKKMLGKNTEQVFSQWIYKNYATIKNRGNSVYIDCKNIPIEAYEKKILSNITIKIWLGNREISEVESNNLSVFGYYKDKFGFGYLTLGANKEMGRLERDVYSFKYKVGKRPLDYTVDNSFFTGCLYGKEENSFKVKIYGKQEIKIRMPYAPKKVLADEKETCFRFEKDVLSIDLESISMKGNIKHIVFK